MGKLSHKKIFSILCFIEIFIVLYLAFKIYKSRKIYYAKININVINKKNIIHNQNSKLKYFFEPAANAKGSKYEEAPIPWHPQTITYSINEDFLNEEKNYSYKKEKKTFRIITLGDSFTFGVFVNTKDNWTEQVENELNKKLKCKNIKKIEVINLGVPGFDIQYSIERYRLRGIKYNPDLVIWFLKDDDFEDINELMRQNTDHYTRKMMITGEYDDLISKGVVNPIINKLISDMSQIRKKLGENTVFELQKRYLESINPLYKNGLILLTFPFTKSEYKSYLINFSKIRPRTFYKELSDFNFQNDTFYPDDSHTNLKGHLVIAQDLFNYLTKNEIIPCD